MDHRTAGPAIRKLVDGGDLQLSLFDEKDLAEINIAVRADRALRRSKVHKHSDTECIDNSFSWTRNEGRIAQEAALDDIYVIRTNVPADKLPAKNAVRAYKSLSRVERAFRSYKLSWTTAPGRPQIAPAQLTSCGVLRLLGSGYLSCCWPV